MWAILCCLLCLGTQEYLETEGSAWYLRSPEEIWEMVCVESIGATLPGWGSQAWAHWQRCCLHSQHLFLLLLQALPVTLLGYSQPLSWCLLFWSWGLQSILSTDVPVHDASRLVMVFHVSCTNLYLTPPCCVLECFRGIFAQPPARCGRTQPITVLSSSHCSASLRSFSPEFSRHWNGVLSISHSFYHFYCTPLPLSEQLLFAIVICITVWIDALWKC